MKGFKNPSMDLTTVMNLSCSGHSMVDDDRNKDG